METNVTIKEELGSGSQGIVYSAVDSLGNIYAYKEQDNITLPELQCGYLNHPNLLRYLKVTPEIEIFASPVGKPLSKIIKDLTVTIEDRCNIIKDIVSGLHHMHINGFIHRDLGSHNIVVDSDKRAIIIDFGRSTYRKNSANGDELDYSFDLRTLAILIYELLTRQDVQIVPRQESRILENYTLSKVKDASKWAKITHQLINSQINTNQLASELNVKGTKLPIESFNPIRDLRECYRQVINKISKSTTYYLVVYVTTIYATTNLNLNVCVQLITNSDDYLDPDYIFNNKFVRPMVIEKMEDALKIHKLISSGDSNYYLDLETNLTTSLPTLMSVLEQNSKNL